MFETKIEWSVEKLIEKKFKKFLTNVDEYDKLNEPILNGETKRTLIIKQ